MNIEWGCADGNVVEIEELPFYNSDSESLHDSNLLNNRNQLEEDGWIPIKMNDERELVGHRYLYNAENPSLNDWVNLSYKINSHGFRCDQEMPTETKPRSVIAIGCSNTFGVGMPVGLTWPTLVGQAFRYRAYNLGVPGGSLDTAFRVLLYWLPKIRSSHVFLLEPPGVRYETHTISGIKKSSVHTPIPVPLRFGHEDEWKLHKEKTMRAILSVCDQFDAKFIHCSSDIIGQTSRIGKQDVARDLQHPGRTCHKWIAMNMLKKAGMELSGVTIE